MRHTLSISTTLATVCAFGFSVQANAAPSITVYLSAPKAQFAPASFTNTAVETFDSLSVGTKTGYAPVGGIGTYSGTFASVANDQYGNGTGNYFTFGKQIGSSAPVTLTFATPAAYFGFAYCAGDNNNGITFYDGNNSLLGRFSTATLLTVLKNGQGTVTATDSTVYNTSQYFGKPGATNTNPNEPYSFVNFFFSGGTVGRVVFDNSGSLSTGFESDNHTVSATPQSTAGTPFVFVGSVAIVPESGTAFPRCFAALPALAMVRGRRRG